MRCFDVTVEGEVLLDDYDPFGARGFGVPDTHTTKKTVEDGTLDITFTHEFGAPKLSGIEIRRITE